MADSQPPRSGWPIYLYVPNLIACHSTLDEDDSVDEAGYARIIANATAFGVAFTDKNLFATLYFISFVCDELDGRFARMFNQTSTFGAVLDMVTDRVSTAALLVLLTHFYKSWYGLFLGLLALDICSHWLQMYSTFLSSKSSHKDMGDSKSTLLRLYYHHRFFMGYCAIGAEVAYLLLYMLAAEGNQGNPFEVFQALLMVSGILDSGSPERFKTVTLGAFETGRIYGILLVAALPGCAIKQLVNLVQIKAAADICVNYDIQQYNLKNQ